MALPVDFEIPLHDDIRKRTYVHPDCLDLPTAEISNREKEVIPVQFVAEFQTKLGEQETVDVVSAWQMHPAELQHCIETGGVVYLRVVGGQPPVSITGYNPLLFQLQTP